MAGLLAWAADVVGGGGEQGISGEGFDISAAFTEEQRRYAADLDRRAVALRSTVEELRGRIPPADIAKSLPHLHAHSLASTAALALQLNSHSTTREQAQIRENRLQEENIAYEKAIQTCHKKIHEKQGEAKLCQDKLKEMHLIQMELEEKLLCLNCDNKEPTAVSNHSKNSEDTSDSKEPSREILIKQLEEKKCESALLEENIQNLEKKWTEIQQDLIKRPIPAQREKILERQLHSLIEQLTAKQAQADSFQSDIHAKKLELEKLHALSERLGSGALDVISMRSRSGRAGMISADYAVEDSHRHPAGSKIKNVPKSMLLRSAFVVYILVLHVLVFIKISV